MIKVILTVLALSVTMWMIMYNMERISQMIDWREFDRVDKTTEEYEKGLYQHEWEKAEAEREERAIEEHRMDKGNEYR